MQPVELEIELLCRGLRLDPSFEKAHSRRIARTRAGLGSGLELILPSTRKDIWVNVPVVEPFARESPFILFLEHDRPWVCDERDGSTYAVRIPPEPEWYSRNTSSGTLMSRVGVLQGNYLGIYISNRCMYWQLNPAVACKFCTTGKNVGENEEYRKTVDDVVEVARAAQEESGSIFTHLNTGYYFEDNPKMSAVHGVRQARPYVQAIREKVGGFIGLQAVPVPRERFDEYDTLIDLGVDHFSFCYEFEDPAVFADLCPGKNQTLGQQAFFDAMEYTSRKLGAGRVSGEIIAGPEPIAATKRGIDRIVNAGAFPTVCIFRPTIGSAMEQVRPPHPEQMKEVFAYLYEACRRANLPIGILPIEVSLVVQPEEGAGLVERSFSRRMYELELSLMRLLARPYIASKMRPRRNAGLERMH